MIKEIIFISFIIYIIYNFDYCVDYFIITTYPFLFIDEIYYYYRRFLLFLKNKLLFDNL